MIKLQETPYWKKSSFNKRMSALAKQERLAREKKEKEKQQPMKEEAEKHHVLAFGRMNPPTAGHEQVVNKVHSVAKEHNAGHSVVLSHSNDAKKNPLPVDKKVEHAKNAFPGTNVHGASKEKPTILHHASDLHKAGVHHLHVVAGSDRHEEMHKLLHKYNGQKAAHGHYNFKSITVHSSGDRDPDSEGTSGVSGTKMREHATSGNKKEFHKNLPSKMKPEHKEGLYNDLRSHMGIHESSDNYLDNLLSRHRRGEKLGKNEHELVKSHLSRSKLYTKTKNAISAEYKEETIEQQADRIKQLRSFKDQVKKLGMDKKEVDALRKVQEAATSGNPGNGYHGQHAVANNSEEAYANFHAVVKALTDGDDKTVKHYLDSGHGKGLVGREEDHDHIKKDFKKFMKYYRPTMHEKPKVNEEIQIDELTNTTLQSYKDKAKKSADELAAKGEYKKSNDRMMGHMKASGKQIQKTSANIGRALRGEPVKEGATQPSGDDLIYTSTSAPTQSTAKDDTAMVKKIKGFKFFRGVNEPNTQMPVKENAPVAPVPDKKYIKGTPEWKKHKESQKPRTGHPTNVKEEADQIDEVAPPGFEGTVKAMKKHKEIDNPWALAWYMKNKGMKSHKKADGSMKEEFELSEDAFDKAEENKKSADSAKKQGDMYAHHLHMSDFHNNRAQYHFDGGRLKLADVDTQKAKEHHSKAMKLKEEVEVIDEKSQQARRNKTYKNLMAASKGARVNRDLGMTPADTGHKNNQQMNKAIGRAVYRGEVHEGIGKPVDVEKVNAAGDKPHEEKWETAPKKITKVKKEETMKTYKEFLQSLDEKLIGGQKKLDKNKNGKLDKQDFEMLRKEETESLDEIKMADLPSRKITGTSYGANYEDPEGKFETKDDMKKPEKKSAGRKSGSVGVYKPRKTMSKLKSAGATYK